MKKTFNVQNGKNIRISLNALIRWDVSSYRDNNVFTYLPSKLNITAKDHDIISTYYVDYNIKARVCAYNIEHLQYVNDC